MSSGRMFEVPKLLGVGITRAKTDLEKLGLEAAVRWVAMAPTPTYEPPRPKASPIRRVKPEAARFS